MGCDKRDDCAADGSGIYYQMKNAVANLTADYTRYVRLRTQRAEAGSCPNLRPTGVLRVLSVSVVKVFGTLITLEARRMRGIPPRI
jgi:hypothetical protein